MNDLKIKKNSSRSEFEFILKQLFELKDFNNQSKANDLISLKSKRELKK